MSEFDQEPHIMQAPPVVKILGDRTRGEMLRGRALQLLRTTKEQNFQNLPAWQMIYFQDPKTGEATGSRAGADMFVCSVTHGQEQVTIHAATTDSSPSATVTHGLDLPVAGRDQFYHVPGCVARYWVRGDDLLRNEIPGGVEDAGNWALGNMSRNVRQFVGLPPGGKGPAGLYEADAPVVQIFNVYESRHNEYLSFAGSHIKIDGDFSISCIVRLNREIQYDYLFEEMSDYNNMAVIYNPYKPKILFSNDGQSWQSDCPGRVVPLVGIDYASRLSRHYSRVSYPWAPYNNNFLDSYRSMIGMLECVRYCDDEPEVSMEYSPGSAYWDKVGFGDIRVLSGEFGDSWDRNSEFRNAAAYQSFSRFSINGDVDVPAGARVVGATYSGMKRYGVVYSVVKSVVGDLVITTVTIMDWQYKKYIRDCVPDLQFGIQPFPVCNPHGYAVGVQALGLCWYNKRQILAGKICSIDNDYVYPKLISDPLEIGRWYHVGMTYAGGVTKLFIAAQGGGGYVVKGMQSDAPYYDKTSFGEKLSIYIGGSAWNWVSQSGDHVSTAFSAHREKANMDIGMLRFFHRAVTDREMTLLTREAFRGVFVADDHEVMSLAALGYAPVQV